MASPSLDVGEGWELSTQAPRWETTSVSNGSTTWTTNSTFGMTASGGGKGGGCCCNVSFPGGRILSVALISNARHLEVYSEESKVSMSGVDAVDWVYIATARGKAAEFPPDGEASSATPPLPMFSADVAVPLAKPTGASKTLRPNRGRHRCCLKLVSLKPTKQIAHVEAISVVVVGGKGQSAASPRKEPAPSNAKAGASAEEVAGNGGAAAAAVVGGGGEDTGQRLTEGGVAGEGGAAGGGGGGKIGGQVGGGGGSGGSGDQVGGDGGGSGGSGGGAVGMTANDLREAMSTALFSIDVKIQSSCRALENRLGERLGRVEDRVKDMGAAIAQINKEREEEKEASKPSPLPPPPLPPPPASTTTVAPQPPLENGGGKFDPAPFELHKWGWPAIQTWLAGLGCSEDHSEALLLVGIADADALLALTAEDLAEEELGIPDGDQAILLEGIEQLKRLSLEASGRGDDGAAAFVHSSARPV